MKKKKGPNVVIIPEQKYMSCRGCEWLNIKLWKSGREPVYKNYCSHEQWRNESGGWVKYGKEGKEINEHENCNSIETPDWCPVLSQVLKMIEKK